MEGNEVAAMDISRIINRILYLVFHADSVRDAHAKFYYWKNRRKRDQRVILHYFLLRIYEKYISGVGWGRTSVFRIWTTDKEYHHLLSSESYHGICRIGGFLIFYHPRYLSGIALQFFQAFIIEENAGIIESLHKSWEITKGQALPLFILALVMIGILILGCILFGIGIFVAVPLIYMMYGYVFRKLNTPLQILE